MSDSTQQFGGIELGAEVTDKISGFHGVVTGLAEHISGCDRIGVKPLGEQGSARVDEEFFYPCELDVVETETEFSDAADDAITSSPVSLGDIVRDQISGVEGTVTTQTFELFNCPRVAISPADTDNANEQLERVWVDVPRVEIVEMDHPTEYVDEDLLADESESETARTGAPAQDLSRKSDHA